MPCKHQGGSDPCDKVKNGGNKWRCKVKKAMYQAYYRQTVSLSSGFAGHSSRGKKVSGDSGEAGELLVAVDLLKRGLEVTKPLNRSTKDDIHFKTSKGWKTLQSRVTKVNQSTHWIQSAGKKGITSDVIAWVDLAGLRIRYESNTKESLPIELR